MSGTVQKMVAQSGNSSITSPSHAAWTLNEGDLCVWTGKQSEHSSLKNHIIYQVVSKKIETSPPLTPGGTPTEHQRFMLRAAYDFTRPTGVAINTVSWSDHELRKLTLVDLGVIRLTFDNFIREYARQQGMDAVTDNEVPGT